MMRKVFRSSIFVILLGSLLLWTVACGSAEQAGEKDSSAKVALDYENSVVVYPIDAYMLSAEDEAIIRRATEEIVASCTVNDGFPVNVTIGAAPFDVRPYGLWNVERARNYGFGMPGLDPNSQEFRQYEEVETSDAWRESRERCLQVPEIKERLDLISPLMWVQNPENNVVSVVDRVRSEAATFASREPAWTESIDSYKQCLRDNGLTPVDGWGSDEGNQIAQSTDQTPETKEREIRIATSEAQCNQDVGLTQKLGDLEASYQAPLIRKNEASLSEEKRALDANVAAAREETQ